MLYNLCAVQRACEVEYAEAARLSAVEFWQEVWRWLTTPDLKEFRVQDSRKDYKLQISKKSQGSISDGSHSLATLWALLL